MLLSFSLRFRPPTTTWVCSLVKGIFVFVFVCVLLIFCFLFSLFCGGLVMFVLEYLRANCGRNVSFFFPSFSFLGGGGVSLLEFRCLRRNVRNLCLVAEKMKGNWQKNGRKFQTFWNCTGFFLSWRNRRKWWVLVNWGLMEIFLPFQTKFSQNFEFSWS